MQLLRDTTVPLKRKSDPTSILVTVLTSSGLKQLNSLICVTNLLSMVMQRSHQWKLSSKPDLTGHTSESLAAMLSLCYPRNNRRN